VERRLGQRLLLAGGVCGILWPILSLGWYAVYPIAASGAIFPQSEGLEGFATRLAGLGLRPAVLALEWANAALPLLLWPFLLALRRVLERRGERPLAVEASMLGLAGMSLMVVSAVANPTLLHALGRAYVDAESGAKADDWLRALEAVIFCAKGMNQVASLLYQGCVALISLALVRARTWRAWGWVGLAGAVLALPAKLSLGLRVPTNAIWTGLAYGLWPVAVGIGLLGYRWEES
jgi:hypothetical protein